MPSTPSQPVNISPGLWISGISGLDAIEQLKITHIVSVINGTAPEAPNAADCQRLHIDVEDYDDGNLLVHLPMALEFINAALNDSNTSGSSNAVLIHCAQGTSRSAAVALAYLMKRQTIDPDAALEALRKSYPIAAPNSGFMHQLHLFHCMNYTLDTSYVPYRRFLAEQAAFQYNTTGVLDATQLSMPSVSTSQPGACLYRCRKCRILLATSDNILETEAGGSGFAWRKRDKFQKESDNTVTSGDDFGGGIFVEPLRWMADTVDGQIQGKLYCPKCTARLGAFNWSGIQNSTGGWVTPGFHLHLARMDVEDPQKQAALDAQLGRLNASGNGEVAPSPSTAAAAALATGGGASAAALRQPKLLPRRHAPLATAFPFTHLILDCDGVMVDSERPSCEALRRSILAVTGFDIPHSFPEDFRPVFGMDVRHCVEYYAHRFSNEYSWGSEADIEAIAQRATETKEWIYKELTADGVEAFPGVKELIENARERGMGVAVASSGSPEKIAHNLGSSGLAGQVPEELIVSAKYVARGKPAPDVYLEALKRVKCSDASKALVVEDAVNGLKAAKAAGCFAIGVATSLPKEALEPYADYVVERLKDLDLDQLINCIKE